MRFSSVEKCELVSKATGEVTSATEDRRGHVWTFARRVPPELPVETLDSPWRLVRVG